MTRAEERHNYIHNICGYDPEDKSHQVQTIQITSRSEWQQLQLPCKYDYVRNLLNDLDNGLGNTNGQLRVSLLRVIDRQTGGYPIIFFIHTSPHHDSIDGHLVDFIYTKHDPQLLAILEVFERSPFTMFEEWPETHILDLLAEELQVGYLVERYFSSFIPFESARIDVEFNLNQQDVHDNLLEEHFAIPPPPPMENGITLEALYFAEIANQGNDDQGDDEFDNIIPYWLESEERIQQLMEIRNGF